jgi:hypothetical protein
MAAATPSRRVTAIGRPCRTLGRSGAAPAARKGEAVPKYRVETVSLSKLEEFLNQTADEGWELVSVISPGGAGVSCTVILRWSTMRVTG